MEKKQLSHLGNSVVSAGDKAWYNTAEKETLADKQVLAWILKWTTDKYKDMEISENMKHIENSSMSEIPVFPGLSNEAIDGIGF